MGQTGAGRALIDAGAGPGARLGVFARGSAARLALVRRPRDPYLCRMRLSAPVPPCLAASLALGLGISPAAAQPKPATHSAAPARSAPAKPEGPKAIGKFEDWTAATHPESGQTVCYAFTRALSSQPAQSGRGDVVLTVTERASLRDAVAISAGFTYPSTASVNVTADSATFEFYTSQRSAFARDGHAVVGAFQKAGKVVAKSPSPKNTTVTDTFSLRGFTAAYNAIVKACAPK
jgi:hypothetical protein